SSGSLSLPVDNSTVGLSDASHDFSFMLFPNPSAGELSLFSASNSLIEYHIYDLSGRELKQGTFTGKLIVPLRDISPGMYMVHCRTGSANRTERLVIVR